MNAGNWLLISALFLTLAVAGCKNASTSEPHTSDTHGSKAPASPADAQEKEAEIKAALAKLSPEDRQLAEKQGFCVVMNDSRLGSMGTPIKITVKDRQVFVCCKGCVKKALKNPDQTLAKAEELKAKTAGSPTK